MALSESVSAVPLLDVLACFANQAQAENGTLKRVADRATLTIGYRTDAPPVVET